MKHSQVDTGVIHLATDLTWEVPGGEDREEFPELSQGHATSGSYGTVAAPTGAQHVTQVVESGFHIMHGVVDIHMSHALLHLGQT